MDWKDLTRKGELHAYLVSPNNLEIIEEELLGIDWSSLKISGAYYSDSRTSGSLRTHYANWNQDDAHTPFVRIVYEIPEWNYTRELGTFIVRNDPQEIAEGTHRTDLELQSMLYALSLEFPEKKKAITPGALVSTAIKSELNDAGLAYVLDDICEYQVNGLAILENGKSRLARLFTLTEMSNNRIDVDGHGTIRLKRYIEPNIQTASCRIDLNDPRGIVKDGIKRTSNYLQQPSEAVIVYKWTETENGESVEHEITAKATVRAGDHASVGARGYKITAFEQVNDLSPRTAQKAQDLAYEKLRKQMQTKTEWQINTTYLPLWEGDIVELYVPYGAEQYQGIRKCLVKNIELSGEYLDMTLTLKETAGGDEE